MAGKHVRFRPTARPLLRLLVALSLFAGMASVSAAPPTVAAAALPAWTGSASLYSEGVFTTQQSWLWCTAADVQIARNIVYGERDHAASGQRRYFEWMRDRNRYALPVSAGVDPEGWTAGMRQFVDDRYRLVASETFDAALRLAVQRLRLTGLPVALTVSHGGHGWLLTGFAASADPATTDDFETTSVRVVGPLYGLQSKDGYDMRPNTQLTTAQLRRYFTPWRYEPMRMIWDGQYVSIQPVPTDPPPVGAPTPSAALEPSAEATPSAAPSPAASEVSLPSYPLVAGAIGSSAPLTTSSTPDATTSSDSSGILPLLAVLIALSAVVITLAARHVRSRAG